MYFDVFWHILVGELCEKKWFLIANSNSRWLFEADLQLAHRLVQTCVHMCRGVERHEIDASNIHITIHIIPYQSISIHINPYQSIRIHQDPMESHGILWNPMDSAESSWGTGVRSPIWHRKSRDSRNMVWQTTQGPCIIYFGLRRHQAAEFRADSMWTVWWLYRSQTAESE